ncbi:hypothetical protein SDC9_136635 [bioreactor metagenome]|uniref:Uncharacterized protein n=1 Tax=bioreactor metagenome TaxID=1076179 RepID=A0A645DJN7_9ZZZZ|nr:hypothetical protein [Anaerotignum propionicum]MEA5057713.1 hypothetical protein [Anaerotignum propionicum]
MIQAIETIAKNKQDDIQAELNKTDELIAKYSQEKSELKNEIITIDYPNMIFYEGEDINPDKLTEKLISNQIDNILAVGCNESIRLINGLLERRTVSKKKKSIEKLIREFDENIEGILASIRKNYYDPTVINKFVDERKGIDDKTSKVLKLNAYDSVLKFINDNPKEFIELVDLNHYMTKLSDIEIEKNSLEKNIQVLQEGNNVIAALSDLVKYRDAFFNISRREMSFVLYAVQKKHFHHLLIKMI